MNSIYLVCRREGKQKCLWLFLLAFFDPSLFLSLFWCDVHIENSCAIKINIKSLFGSLSWFVILASLGLSIATTLMTYLRFFVKDSMVSVVGLKGTLLHMVMVKQKIAFETSNLKREKIIHFNQQFYIPYEIDRFLWKNGKAFYRSIGELEESRRKTSGSIYNW